MGLIFNKVKNNYLFPINNTVDKIQSVTKGLTCLASSLFGAGASISVASIMSGIGAVAAGLAGAILSAVQGVILRRVYQMVNSALSPLRQIRGIIDDLRKSFVGIQKLLDKATTLDNYISSRQQCNISGANIFNCIIQNAINGVTDKVAMKVDKFLAPLANSVTKKAMDTNGSIYNSVKRHTEFLDKGKLQNKLMR